MTTQDIERIMALSRAHRQTPPDRILLGNHQDIASEDRGAIATQLSLATLLERKLPSWHLAETYIPSALNLEQCSSQQTAALKEELFVHPSDILLDLTGGLGVDFAAMARSAQRSIYVEQSPHLVAAAQYNLPRLLTGGIPPPIIIEGESLTLLSTLISTERPTLIYVDPARRHDTDQHRRVYAIEDCTPSLSQLEQVIRSHLAPDLTPRFLVKLSPMLDIKHTLRAHPLARAVYIVALRGEVKELLLAYDFSFTTPIPLEQIPIHTIDLRAEGRNTFSATYADEQMHAPLYASTPNTYIYEPGAAVMKSGLFHSLGHAYGLAQLHPHSHLYTSSEQIKGFVGRSFRVEEVIPFSSSTARNLRGRFPRADISCRNFPLSPEELRRKLRIPSAGTTTLMATTLYDGALTLLHLTRT